MVFERSYFALSAIGETLLVGTGRIPVHTAGPHMVYYHLIKIAFGQENPFLGTEGGAGCSLEDCVVLGMKLLGNFSGPFQIEVTFRTELLL